MAGEHEGVERDWRIEEEQGRRKWRGQIRDFKLSIKDLKKMLENEEVQERRCKGDGDGKNGKFKKCRKIRVAIASPE